MAVERQDRLEARSRAPIVCLGETLVDLIGEPPGGPPQRYEVHFGGALGNVAVAIARAGAPAALAGGSGGDSFGELLRARLIEEGVDISRLREVPGLVTPFAFVDLDADGEPSFRIHGDGIEAGLAALAGSESEIVAGASALVIGSNTLVGEKARAVTVNAVAAAERERLPLLFDPNLRPGRWRELGDAIELCRQVARSCFLVKANLAEARLLVGDRGLDATAAAEALAGLGPELAVVTAGPDGAVARGAASEACLPEPVENPRPLGAGDAFMGALAAGLHARAWDPGGIEGALPGAVAAAAEACRRSAAT